MYWAHARLESAQEEVGHGGVCFEILGITFLEVDAEEPRVELVAGNSEPYREGIRVECAVDARYCA